VFACADDDVWWCLVDNTERVAAANAASAALAASQEAAADAGGAAAAAASSSATKKQLDVGALAKLHNPTLFSEREIPFFKALVWAKHKGGTRHAFAPAERAHADPLVLRLLSAQLDGLLESPSGALPLSDVVDFRLTAGGGAGAAARKLQLSAAEASYASSKLRGKARTQYLALGERVYAELKAYVERKADGRQCSACKQQCVLVSALHGMGPLGRACSRVGLQVQSSSPALDLCARRRP
jgi:hypothetical protein